MIFQLVRWSRGLNFMNVQEILSSHRSLIYYHMALFDLFVFFFAFELKKLLPCFLSSFVISLAALRINFYTSVVLLCRAIFWSWELGLSYQFALPIAQLRLSMKFAI